MELPLCDVCGERPATVYIQIIGPDVQQEKRLCAQCAVEHELDVLPFALGISPEGEVDISLRQPERASETRAPRELADERCSGSGATGSDVAGKGLADCPDCYEDLPRTIAELIATVQPGHSADSGRAQEAPPELSALARLQLRLAEAAGNEDYERAARLRDDIRRLGG